MSRLLLFAVAALSLSACTDIYHEKTINESFTQSFAFMEASPETPYVMHRCERFDDSVAMAEEKLNTAE